MTNVIVQLIEPDGTEGLRMTYEAAIAWCERHLGWSWRHVDEGPLP